MSFLPNRRREKTENGELYFMTSELEDLLIKLLNSKEEGSTCPLCENGILKYKPSSFIHAIIFQCSECKAYLRWFQLSYAEKETVINSILQRWVRNLTDKQKKRILRSWGLV